MNTRYAQPYRKRSSFRRQGAALFNMTRGKTLYGRHPLDRKRRLRKAGPLGRRRRRRLSVRSRSYAPRR